MPERHRCGIGAISVLLAEQSNDDHISYAEPINICLDSYSSLFNLFEPIPSVFS